MTQQTVEDCLSVGMISLAIVSVLLWLLHLPVSCTRATRSLILSLVNPVTPEEANVSPAATSAGVGSAVSYAGSLHGDRPHGDVRGHYTA